MQRVFQRAPRPRARSRPVHTKDRKSAATAGMPDGDNLILLIGAARSGTTWLAKVFDSHPDVIYRHEPDMVVQDNWLNPSAARPESVNGDACEYVRKLADVRVLKSAGSLPQFPKRYRSTLQNALHAGLVFGARALHLAGISGQRLAIPDMVKTGRHPTHIAIKAVTLRNIVGSLARAMPRSRVIFIIRHPCGQVNSVLRGIRERQFEHDEPFDDAAATPEAGAAGLSRAAFDSLDLVEQAAWNWAVLNQKAVNDLTGLPNVRSVLFRDAYEYPRDIARELLEFSGLGWNPQTEAFVRRSSTPQISGRYYSVRRSSPNLNHKWRTELSETDQERILAIANRFPVGRIFDR